LGCHVTSHLHLCHRAPLPGWTPGTTNNSKPSLTFLCQEFDHINSKSVQQHLLPVSEKCIMKHVVTCNEKRYFISSNASDSECESVHHVCAGAHEVQKRASDPLELPDVSAGYQTQVRQWSRKHCCKTTLQPQKVLRDRILHMILLLQYRLHLPPLPTLASEAEPDFR
ncbi:hypothetical protein STEG23_005323, partial [Scotinomys teguina]